MSTLTITEFLEARIAEDEAVAHAATDGPWRLDPGSSGVYRIEVGYREFASDPEGLTFYAERGWTEDATHIARHDPARALAECAAKRAIIERHKDWPVLVATKPEFNVVSTDPQGTAFRAAQELAWLTVQEYVKRFGVQAPTTNMVKAIASVYADHPDYDPEWAL